MNSINRLILISISAVFLMGCQSKNSIKEIEVVKFENLEQAYTKNDDVLYVVNFWATWCAPCVKELPEFMAVNETFKENSKYKMILVSLDDAENIETAVKPMIKQLSLNVEQYLLDDVTRMNEWIPAINPEWSGTIPATLFIKNGKTLKFISTPLSKEELENTITQYL